MFTRRDFLAGTAATLAASQLAPHIAHADGQHAEWPPKALLTSTFDPLSASLVASPEQWAPYPKAGSGWNAVPQDLRDALLSLADDQNAGEWKQILATDLLDFKRTGNRDRFQNLHFGRRARLATLVVGECIANNGKYLDQVANGLWLIFDEAFWGVTAHLPEQKAGVGLPDITDPIIDLFAAETAATVSWIVYLLGEQLNAVSPQLVKRAHLEMQRRILDPFLLRDDFHWMGLNGKRHHLNNWNPWINSNVLTAALLMEPDAARRAKIVNKVCRSVDQYIGDCSPDGGCEEGPGYWGRAAASVYDVLWTLVRAHGGKGNAALTHPYITAIGHFIPDVHIVDGLYVNYGDAHLHAAPEPEFAYRMGRDTNDPDLMALGAADAATHGLATSGTALKNNAAAALGGVASFSRALLAIHTAAEIRTATDKHLALPRDAWYPALGLMTAREVESSADGFYVAMQAASNGRSHAHNDSGSFMVFFNGKPVFIDVGVESYTAKTFGKDRYTIWTMQSAFHNLPTVGGAQEHEGNFKGRVEKYSKSDAATSLRVDLAPAYQKAAGITRWMRTVTLNRTAHSIRLNEAFALSKAAPVMLSFMCAQEPVVSGDGVRVGDVLLAFDKAALTPVVERIDLEKSSLKHEWGAAVWRLLLKTNGDVATGDWTMEARKA